MVDEPDQDELEAAHCWEAGDRVPNAPEMTAFRRRVRLHQARWREAHGHPIGTQPMVPVKGKPWRPVGSNLPVDYGQETGANFVTPGALDAVHARLAVTEPHQSLAAQRLFVDLLWAPTLSFNLFGDLAADVGRADRAVHAWWPHTPGTVREVRFQHSPGWLDPEYLGNLMALDTAFVLDVPDGTLGVVGVSTHYYDYLKREVPKPKRLAHYREVAARSGVFAKGAVDEVLATNLLMMWLEHLLVLSMLQHRGREWSWGRYVVVHPEGNVSFTDACARYRALLKDESTFACITLESLLASRGARPPKTVKLLRDRYLPR